MNTYTYDGNSNENYSLFENGSEIAELICGEDAAIDVVALLNSGSPLSNVNEIIAKHTQDFNI